MTQISEHVPLCLTDNEIKKVFSRAENEKISDRNQQAFLYNKQTIRYYYSFMYKRPRHVDILSKIACSWHRDLVEGKQISSSCTESSVLFPSEQMTSPVTGCNLSSLMATMRDGICFYDNRNPGMRVIPNREN
jgi:hypothetical protein